MPSIIKTHLMCFLSNKIFIKIRNKALKSIQYGYAIEFSVIPAAVYYGSNRPRARFPLPFPKRW
jgi:hypothetical protein